MRHSCGAAETTPIMHGATDNSEAPPLVPSSDDSAPSWMTPRAVLFAFTALNFLLYFDRGATAGALSAIRVDSQLVRGGDVLSDAKGGLLVSGFTIGYLVASPFFASRGSVWGSRMVLLLGMLVWCVTCLGCAVALRYGVLLVCRIIVGVGEAAFVGFTVTIIDNIAPPARRTSWIGFFYAMIPVGTAVGMGCGGVMTTYASVAGVASWRLLFLGEVVAALPIIAVVYVIPARFHLPPAATDAPAAPFLTATLSVLRNVNYMLLVLGLSTYCFVTGAVSTWGIPLLHEGPLQLSATAAAILMGAATTAGGVMGSLLGGTIVDRLGGSGGTAGAIQCQKFDIAMVLVSIPCGVVALAAAKVVLFTLAFVAAVVALFAITAPVNASILTVVPADLRPYAVSYSVFFIHLLGDFPSPALTGLVSDVLGRHCRGLAQQRCAEAPAAFTCAWVSDAADGHCTNRLQLRNALLLVFLYLIVAPPCWFVVWWRLRRTAAAEAAGDVPIVEEANTPPSMLADEAAASPFALTHRKVESLNRSIDTSSNAAAEK